MLKKLHKIIGLSVCLIIIHLSITGIILMYPSTFKLQDTYFKNRYISSLYDMYTVADVRALEAAEEDFCLLYTSPSPRDGLLSRMPSSA